MMRQFLFLVALYIVAAGALRHSKRSRRPAVLAELSDAPTSPTYAYARPLTCDARTIAGFIDTNNPFETVLELVLIAEPSDPKFLAFVERKDSKGVMRPAGAAARISGQLYHENALSNLKELYNQAREALLSSRFCSDPLEVHGTIDVTKTKDRYAEETIANMMVYFETTGANRHENAIIYAQKNMSQFYYNEFILADQQLRKYLPPFKRFHSAGLHGSFQALYTWLASTHFLAAAQAVGSLTSVTVDDIVAIDVKPTAVSVALLAPTQFVDIKNPELQTKLFSETRRSLMESMANSGMDEEEVERLALLESRAEGPMRVTPQSTIYAKTFYGAGSVAVMAKVADRARKNVSPNPCLCANSRFYQSDMLSPALGGSGLQSTCLVYKADAVPLDPSAPKENKIDGFQILSASSFCRKANVLSNCKPVLQARLNDTPFMDFLPSKPAARKCAGIIMDVFSKGDDSFPTRSFYPQFMQALTVIQRTSKRGRVVILNYPELAMEWMKTDNITNFFKFKRPPKPLSGEPALPSNVQYAFITYKNVQNAIVKACTKHTPKLNLKDSNIQTPGFRDIETGYAACFYLSHAKQLLFQNLGLNAYSTNIILTGGDGRQIKWIRGSAIWHSAVNRGFHNFAATQPPSVTANVMAMAKLRLDFMRDCESMHIPRPDSIQRGEEDFYLQAARRCRVPLPQFSQSQVNVNSDAESFVFPEARLNTDGIASAPAGDGNTKIAVVLQIQE